MRPLSAPIRWAFRWLVPYQRRATWWVLATFGEDVFRDTTERGDRFLEEALELLQSVGYDRSRIAAMVDYVYSRPKGEPSQEAGGVVLTLAALCQAERLDMVRAGEAELDRVWTRSDQVRAKHATKASIHAAGTHGGTDSA